MKPPLANSILNIMNEFINTHLINGCSSYHAAATDPLVIKLSHREFHLPDNYQTRWIQSTDYQLLYILRGSGLLNTINQSTQVIHSQAFWINPHQRYKLQTTLNSPLNYVIWTFELQSPTQPMLAFDTSFVTIFPSQHSQGLDMLLHKSIESLNHLRHIPNTETLQTMVFNHLLSYWTHDSEPNLPSLSPLIHQATLYIHHHFRTDLSIQEVANHIQRSSWFLSTQFKAETGYSPQEYWIQLRLEHACDLLQNSCLSIQQIADESGFRSKSYFATYFKRTYHLTPTEYRKRNKINLR